MIHARCRCGKQLAIPEVYLGRVAPCPACQQSFRLVAPACVPDTDDFTFSLRIETAPDRVGEQIFLGGRNPILIGKRADNDIVLDDPSVSRYHCRLIREEDTWRIEDEGSKNGVRINGDRVTSADLKDGDMIGLGHITLQYVDMSLIEVAAGSADATSAGHSKPPPVDDGLYALADMEGKQPTAEVAPPAFATDATATLPAATAAGSGDGRSSAQGAATQAATMPGARGTSGDWIESTERSFWGDAAWSFVFFLDGGNAATLATICVLTAVVSLIGMVPFLGCAVFVLEIALRGWLCAFYFNVVAETARGEDALPDVRVTSIFDDLILPAFRFAACWLVVLLPAIVLAIVMVRQTGQVAWDTVALVAAIGLLLWPVMVLGTAIGGGLPLRSIPLLILTVLQTIVPYLVVCVLVAAAAAIAVGAQTGLEVLVLSKVGAKRSPFAPFVFQLFGSVAQAYASIVAMRVIGLYYRHFKSRFPWRAE